MTRRTGNPERKAPVAQRVPNPFESTEDTSTGVDHAPTDVCIGATQGPPDFPVRRFRIEDGPAPQRAYGHVLTTRGWVREG